MRTLTEDERRLLSRIFDHLAAGQEEFEQQAKTAKVAPLDEEGSIRFEVPHSAPAAKAIIDRVPVTAIFDDIDGVPIYILLHVINGILNELEIYKADGSQIICKPLAERLYF